MYKDISLNVQLFQREIVMEPNICFGLSKNDSQRLFLWVLTTHVSDIIVKF